MHLLVSVPTNESVAELLRVVKANSSRWVHEQFPAQRGFAWQAGYAAFSVSGSRSGLLFDKYHELIGLKCSAETILGLAQKLKTALEYKKQTSHVNMDIGQGVYQIKVLRVLSEGLKDGAIGFVDEITNVS